MSVTVTIPVGPHEANKRWLGEAIESVQRQTYSDIELLLIDDGADLPQADLVSDAVRVWKSPWRLGVAHAFNFGVALAKNNLVFLLGSDDWLAPDCIEQCVKAYEKETDRDQIYFNVPIVLHKPNGETVIMKTRSGAALVTQTLWDRCGGFPSWSALCCSDVALYSMLDSHPELGRTVRVGDRPLYHYRDHPDADTMRLRKFVMPKMTLNGRPATLVDLVRILARSWGNRT